MNRADEFDVIHSGVFVNSSLAPVLRLDLSMGFLMASLAGRCSYGPYWPFHLV